MTRRSASAVREIASSQKVRKLSSCRLRRWWPSALLSAGLSITGAPNLPQCEPNTAGHGPGDPACWQACQDPARRLPDNLRIVMRPGAQVRNRGHGMSQTAQHQRARCLSKPAIRSRRHLAGCVGESRPVEEGEDVVEGSVGFSTSRPAGDPSGWSMSEAAYQSGPPRRCRSSSRRNR